MSGNVRAEKKSGKLPLLIVALALALGGAVAAWRFWPTAPAVARPLAVVISGDTAGWIVPCGCTANQSGGLPRRGTFVRDLRQQAEVIVADAGGAPAGTAPYQRLKFEAVLRGELAMGLDAHNLGGPEADLGADELRRLGRELNVSFVSANLRDARGQPIAEPLRIIERAGRRVAIAGVLSRRFARGGLQVDEPREALLAAVAAVRGKYDALVVLAYLPEEELRAFAAALPEADAVVGGPTGQAIAPQPAGPTLLAAATNKGKFLIHLDAAPKGSPWKGQVMELTGQFADDPDQTANLRRYRDDLGRRDFPAADTGFAAALPPGLPSDYRLAGNTSCKPCHANDCASWIGTKHAHAWETLTARGAQGDPYCQQCHSTGYGLPGGFESALRSPALTAVGCESCHGPSQAHVHTPKVRTPFAAADQCVRCHDHENSPQFAYAPFWDKVRHGARGGSR